MMKNIYTIAGTLLLLGAVLSCTREKALEPEQAGQMRFAVTVEGDTKASMTSADLNQFYLKVTGPDNAFSFYDTIVKEGETWKASSKRLLWKDEKSSITYAAASYGALGADYFSIPVTNDLFTSGATMGLLTDQSTQAKLNAADLLTMKETTLAFADTEDGIVPVTLKHGLAKVNFQLTLAAEYFDNGVGLEASPITGLALSGVHTSFFFRPLTGEVSIPNSVSKGAVIPFQSSYEPGTETAKPALAVAEAILVPEEFDAGALTLYFTVAGKDFQWTNSTPLTFEQGGEYEIPVSVADVAAPAAPTVVDLSTLTADYEAKNGVTLTGTLANNVKISIADGATVTLKDVNITNLGNNCNWAGINCPSDATLVLEGTNTVCAGRDGDGYNNYPGIWIAPDKTLTIQGDGTLTAYSNATNPCGAGIGGGYATACGNIVIEGGTINATGGDRAAGIGSGRSVSCGTITINGGNVTATGGEYAAGIGSAYNGECGNITISGGTVVATGGDYAAGIGGGNNNGTCGTITISGGTVTAMGGEFASGIGSGMGGDCGDITITSGVTSVTATKGDDANSIGAGSGGTCGTVNIEDESKVTQN